MVIQNLMKDNIVHQLILKVQQQRVSTSVGGDSGGVEKITFDNVVKSFDDETLTWDNL